MDPCAAPAARRRLLNPRRRAPSARCRPAAPAQAPCLTVAPDDRLHNPLVGGHAGQLAGAGLHGDLPRLRTDSAAPARASGSDSRAATGASPYGGSRRAARRRTGIGVVAAPHPPPTLAARKRAEGVPWGGMRRGKARPDSPSAAGKAARQRLGTFEAAGLGAAGVEQLWGRAHSACDLARRGADPTSSFEENKLLMRGHLVGPRRAEPRGKKRRRPLPCPPPARSRTVCAGEGRTAARRSPRPMEPA